MQLEIIIGLEIHAQMSTKTKLFSSVDNDAFGVEANQMISPVCMAFPGSLPVLNAKAVELGVKASLALACEVQLFSKFDRKNYFYPDLPSGYQISQLDKPLALGGAVSFYLDGEKKTVRLERLHIENDAGKLVHEGSFSYIDYNRAGTPLMEIVSKPDIRSAKEAKLYAEMVQKILRFSGSSSCDMEKGMMRFDASVSMRPVGEDKLYPRAEIKNLNSFRSLEAAIDYEVSRQRKMWEKGEPLDKEQTVGWDDERATTEVLREKESAADYRYFPEPDLPPILLTQEEIEAWRAELPKMPLEVYEMLLEAGLPEMDAQFYADDVERFKFFYALLEQGVDLKAAHSFVGTVLLKKLKDESLTLEESKVQVPHLVELISLVQSGEISNHVARGDLMDAMLKTGEMPALLVEKLGLKQVSDEASIQALCEAAIQANPKAADDVRSGEMKAIGALVGQVLKASQGKANPSSVNAMLIKLLNS